VISTQGYARQVHRSLMSRDLMAGIPQVALFLLALLAVIFCYGMGMYFMLIPVAVLYVVARVLTGKDPWMIDMVLENIQQKDIYIP
jgi:type IV secretory pathway TrbD component